MENVQFYLLFDHITISGANAVSSPLTYGFPSVTGFLGAIHALSRKIEMDPTEPIYLDGVLIASHSCDVHAYRATNFKDYTFKLTRNPLGKDGKARSIIEEGKVDLDVSLVVEVRCSCDALYTNSDQEMFESQMKKKLLQQRIAGGSVVSIGQVKLYRVDNDITPIIRELIPAFVLMNAKKELLEITDELKQKDPEATGLDALIETATLRHIPTESEKWQTTSIKQGRGWLVPLHIGYQAISPLFSPSEVIDTRDKITSSHFVEAIYSLGKWIFPRRLANNFTAAFWRYTFLPCEQNSNDLYLIEQDLSED